MEDKEKIMNDIDKLIVDIIDMLGNEADLNEFKRALEQVWVSLKSAKELTERLKGNIIDNIKREENE